MVTKKERKENIRVKLAKQRLERSEKEAKEDIKVKRNRKRPKVSSTEIDYKFCEFATSPELEYTIKNDKRVGNVYSNGIKVA